MPRNYLKDIFTPLVEQKGSIKESTWVGVMDSVNWGINTARRMHIACIIELSINKDIKLKKRKEKDMQ